MFSFYRFHGSFSWGPLQIVAIHTFSVIVLGWEAPSSLKLPIIVIIGIWTFVTLMVGVSGATHGDGYWGDTGYCEQVHHTHELQNVTSSSQGAGSLKPIQSKEFFSDVCGFGWRVF